MVPQGDVKRLEFMTKDQRLTTYMRAIARLCVNNGGVLEVDINDEIVGKMFATVGTKDGRRTARFEFTSQNAS